MSRPFPVNCVPLAAQNTSLGLEGCEFRVAHFKDKALSYWESTFLSVKFLNVGHSVLSGLADAVQPLNDASVAFDD